MQIPGVADSTRRTRTTRFLIPAVNQIMVEERATAARTTRR